MAELTDIKAGLQRYLTQAYKDAGFPVQVYKQPPLSVNTQPAIIPLFLEDQVFPTSSALQSMVSLIVLVNLSTNEEGWGVLDDFLSRDGDRSVDKFMRQDPTWDGEIDTCWIERITNQGVRRDFGGVYISGTLTYSWFKS